MEEKFLTQLINQEGDLDDDTWKDDDEVVEGGDEEPGDDEDAEDADDMEME